MSKLKSNHPPLDTIDNVHEGVTVAHLYISALRAYPQKIAAVSSSASLTYLELEQRSWKIAHDILAKGVKPQETVGVLSSNCTDLMAAIIAVQLVGAKYLPIHPMGSIEEQLFALSDSGATLLIADTQSFKERARDLHSLGMTAQVLFINGKESVNAIARANAFEPLTQSNHISRISYTGGTTGMPKGILQSHRTVVTKYMSMLATYEWPVVPKFLIQTPLSHAAGSFILPILMKGGAMYFSENSTSENLLANILEHDVNMTFMVPTQVYRLLDSGLLTKSTRGSMELIIYGAAPISPNRLRQAIELAGPIFAQVYGQSEAPLSVTYLSRQDHVSSNYERLRSCGRPMIGSNVAILDANQQPVSSGDIGELCVKGPLVMEGYLNRPSETELVFKGGWLHTGDVAKMDAEGYIYIVDRMKDMIISGGFNVFPGEIESTLSAHESVAVTAVIGAPDDVWGEKVVAVVVLKPGFETSADTLIKYTRSKLGPLKTPKLIVFLDEMPQTALGKIDKKAIRKQFWAEAERNVA